MKKTRPRIKVAVVTGTRAEFGLLVPVMQAVRRHKRLRLHVVAAGAHFLPPARTIREVEKQFKVAARVPMQKPGKTGRAADAAALGRGIEGFTRAFNRLKPDWVVVLGDRIEAFAAASAASVAGIAVCHIHGGDRAEGIADEAMRHAITKLAHLHCAATKLSAKRIVKMGERREHVHVTGSPAIDGLRDHRPMSSRAVAALCKGKAPQSVFLFHPIGDGEDNAFAVEQFFFAVFMTADAFDETHTILSFAPNHDPGRAHVQFCRELWRRDHGWVLIEHMTRSRFVSLLRWMALHFVPLVGNSSAGLIECAALGVPVINLGSRQAGRERASNVLDAVDPGRGIMDLHERCRTRRIKPNTLFGDGRAGPRIAALLAKTDPHDPALLRKRNQY